MKLRLEYNGPTAPFQSGERKAGGVRQVRAPGTGTANLNRPQLSGTLVKISPRASHCAAGLPAAPAFLPPRRLDHHDDGAIRTFRELRN
jgi:hypothetical protein